SGESLTWLTILHQRMPAAASPSLVMPPMPARLSSVLEEQWVLKMHLRWRLQCRLSVSLQQAPRPHQLRCRHSVQCAWKDHRGWCRVRGKWGSYSSGGILLLEMIANGSG